MTRTYKIEVEEMDPDRRDPRCLTILTIEHDEGWYRVTDGDPANVIVQVIDLPPTARTLLRLAHDFAFWIEEESR